MMVMVGFTKLKKPNAVNPTHSLTSIKIATTRIYGGHLGDHKGLSECKADDYYVAGFYKSDCEKIYCIEELKCCRMITGEFC